MQEWWKLPDTMLGVPEQRSMDAAPMDPTIAVVDVEGTTNLRQIMRAQTSLCQPLVICGALAQWPAASIWDPGVGGFGRLEALAGDASVQVMVAPVGKAFYGDVRSKRLLATTFKDFLHMAKAAVKADKDNVTEQLYLAQAPLLDAEQDHPQPLARLLEDVHMPSFLEDENVTNVNLWVSVNGSKSSTHYDPYQNLLCVVAGEKTVSLWDPRATPGLYPMALHGEAFNHSAVNFADPDHARYPNYRAVLDMRRTVRVKAGDALFIPEGWWHQVDSAGTCIAVNIWWQSRFSALLGTHMDAYYARQAIASLLFTEKKRRLDLVRAYQSASPAATSALQSPRVNAVSSDPAPSQQTPSVATIAALRQSVVAPAAPTALNAMKKKRGRKKGAASASARQVDRGDASEALKGGKAREEPWRSDSGMDRTAAVSREAAYRGAGSTDGCESTGGTTAGAGPLGAEATWGESAEQAAPNSTSPVRGLVNHALPSENGVSGGMFAVSGAQPQSRDALERHGLEDNGQPDVAVTRGEVQTSAGSEEAESASAEQRRRVVQCLSPEEAQLLQTLVLQAGQRHQRSSTSGMNGTSGLGGCRRTADRDCGASEGPQRLWRQSRDNAERVVCGAESDGLGGDDVAGVFATAESAQLRRVLLAMAIAFPRALERLVLYGLSPIAAELLTTRFDDFDRLEPSTIGAPDDDPLRIDSPAAFFERFYAVFEDRNAAMAALLDGKEAFAAEALQDVLTDVQGVSDVSAQSGMTKESVQ